ncbi:unnamed protein product [Rotaria sp. Silwood1]|nr:unnamed protein product [Rotaria sp. Silwood1]
MSITFDTNRNVYDAVLLCESSKCTRNEICIEDMCVDRGSLRFVARWSRQNRQGYLIIRTPLNHTIFYDNSHTNSSADEGRHEVIGDASRVDSIYWPLNTIPPKGFYKICFSTANPGIVQFIYLNLPDNIRSPIVGIQGKSLYQLICSSSMSLTYYLASTTGSFMQYSFPEPFFTLQNMSIKFDTNQNTYSAVLMCGSRTCLMNEACVEGMCVQRGSLSFTARWSRRNSQGYIIVRTPLNHTIYFGNPRTKSSADEGRHEQVGDGSQVDNIYWPSNGIPSKGSYKICFSTGSLLNGTDKSPITVTIEIQRFRQVLCLGYCLRGFQESDMPKKPFIEAAAFPLYDDWLSYKETLQKIYYIVYGNTPNRTIAFKYHATRSHNRDQYSHFQVSFFEAKPGIVQFIYFSLPNTIRSPIVGIQASNTGSFMQYSFQESMSVLPNMSITFDTNQITYSAVLICGSRTCLMNEACVEGMCIQRGSLSFTARWSRRNGQGYIIVRTPLNHTIYFGNPRTKSFADEGRHEQVGDGSQVDNIYWPSNRIPPKGSYKICFSTGSLLNGTDKSPVTVTIEIRRPQQVLQIMTHTFKRSATNLRKCLDTSDTFIGSYSTGMLFSQM